MEKEIYGCFLKSFYNRANLYLQVTTINRMVKNIQKGGVSHMTWNQINYQRNVETERSNRAGEEQKKAELAETVRHNQRSEDTEWFKAQSTDQHYQRSDAVAARNAQTQQSALAESIRHNTETEWTDRQHMYDNRGYWNELASKYRAEIENMGDRLDFDKLKLEVEKDLREKGLAVEGIDSVVSNIIDIVKAAALAGKVK